MPPIYAGDNRETDIPPSPTSSQRIPVKINLQDVPNQRILELGKRLFFDKRLSRNNDISCSTCHVPEKAFSDGLSTAVGSKGLPGTRNTPSLINSSLNASFFWDGRANSLEEQALEPLTSKAEHGFESIDDVVVTLKKNKDIAQSVVNAYDLPASDFIVITHITQALAAYERTLNNSNSPFDRFRTGDTGSLSESQKQGFALFVGKGRCSSCHRVDDETASFTDGKFHRVGVGLALYQGQLAELVAQVAGAPTTRQGMQDLLISPQIAALGRFVITRDVKDIGLFRTPSLRNVGKTAPYMHDGSIQSLSDAIDQELYYRSLDLGRPIVLTPSERKDLEQFLLALSST